MRHKKTRGARVMRFSFAQDANPGTRFMRCAGIIAIFDTGDQLVFFSDIQGQKTPHKGRLCVYKVWYMIYGNHNGS
ncbi:hypothetical protein OkiPb00431_29990 [Escherichia coli]|nr:hypothetical protein ECEH1910_01003 [Escherichia coli O145:H28]